jgi:hypothetical protein
MAAWDTPLFFVLTVAISVVCHVTAAVWYTRKQRVYFERRMDGMVGPIAKTVAQIYGKVLAVAAPSVDLTPVERLSTMLDTGVRVELPADFDARIRGAIQSFANGERAKTAAAMETAEGAAALEETLVGDNDLLELVSFLGLDADTKRKLYAGARYIGKLKARHAAGAPLLQLGPLGEYG